MQFPTRQLNGNPARHEGHRGPRGSRAYWLLRSASLDQYPLEFQ